MIGLKKPAGRTGRLFHATLFGSGLCMTGRDIRRAVCRGVGLFISLDEGQDQREQTILERRGHGILTDAAQRVLAGEGLLASRSLAGRGDGQAFAINGSLQILRRETGELGLDDQTVIRLPELGGVEGLEAAAGTMTPELGTVHRSAAAGTTVELGTTVTAEAVRRAAVEVGATVSPELGAVHRSAAAGTTVELGTTVTAEAVRRAAVEVGATVPPELGTIHRSAAAGTTVTAEAVRRAAVEVGTTVPPELGAIHRSAAAGTTVELGSAAAVEVSGATRRAVHTVSGTTAGSIYVKSGAEAVGSAVEAGTAGRRLADVIVMIVMERVGAARLLIAAAVDVVMIVVNVVVIKIVLGVVQ